MKKKWLWVLIGALVIIGAIVGAVVGLSGSNEPTEEEIINYTEPPKYDVFQGKIEVSAAVSQETADLIKLTYELDDTISAEGSGFLIIRKLTLENRSSDRTVEKAEISLKVFDADGKELFRNNALPFANVGPGESKFSSGLTAFATVNLDKLVKPKRFAVILEKVVWRANTTSTISPLQDPPHKVLINFFVDMRQGRYAQAKGYLSAESLTKYLKYLNEEFGQSYSLIEEALAAIPSNEIPTDIEVVGEPIINGAEATVKCVLHMPAGTQEWSFIFVKESNVWKLVMP